MVKAIETSYKGYRFRSRLEARWAVFFDVVAVKWEYEKEGYDLGEAGWYLPDFYLPETDSFIEVKPKPASFQVNQRLYLAGKFTGGTGKNTPCDWREDFVDLKSFSYGDASDLPTGEWIDSYCGFSYTGPFPIDLASGHASELGHIEDYSCDVELDPDSEGNKSRMNVTTSNKSVKPSPLQFDSDRLGVMKKCLAQIDSADVLFAWIESDKCYGTLAEIGYAKAKGKTVIIGVSDDLAAGDLWFAQSMADVCIRSENATEAFHHVFPLSDDEKKAIALARAMRLDENGKYSWRNRHRKVGIVYGDPSDHLISLFHGESFGRHYDSRISWGSKPGIGLFIPGFTPNLFWQAASAARSARFEHGESPKV